MCHLVADFAKCDTAFSCEFGKWLVNSLHLTALCKKMMNLLYSVNAIGKTPRLHSFLDFISRKREKFRLLLCLFTLTENARENFYSSHKHAKSDPDRQSFAIGYG